MFIFFVVTVFSRWSVEVGEPELLAVKPANLVSLSMPVAAEKASGPGSGPAARGGSPVLRTYASTVGIYAILLLPDGTIACDGSVGLTDVIPHRHQRPSLFRHLHSRHSWLCVAAMSCHLQHKCTASCLTCRLLLSTSSAFQAFHSRFFNLRHAMVNFKSLKFFSPSAQTSTFKLLVFGPPTLAIFK